MLNVELNDLEQALMKAWRLPELLLHVTDDRRANDPQVLAVRLAIRLARHSANGWNNAAIPDDLRDIGELLNLAPNHVQALVRQYD